MLRNLREDERETLEDVQTDTHTNTHTPLDLTTGRWQIGDILLQHVFLGPHTEAVHVDIPVECVEVKVECSPVLLRYK